MPGRTPTLGRGEIQRPEGRQRRRILLQSHEEMEPLGPSLRRSRRREHPLVRVAVALLVSLGLNLALSLVLDSTFLGILPRSDVRPVGLAPLSASAWEANRAVGSPQAAPPPVPAPPPPVPPPPPPDLDRGQIVDLGPARPEDKDVPPPPDAKYLSERNTRVEKETRARNQGLYDRTLPSPTVVVKPGGEGGEADKAIPGRAGSRGEGSKPQRLASAAPPAAPAPPDDQQRGDSGGGEPRPREPWLAPTPAPGDGGEGGERLRGRLDPRLATSPETLARLAGGPAPDYLGDLEEGSATLLNSRQWKYTTYFTAMRPGIYANWKPEEAYLMRDPEGTMFPARKWITYLEVVLDDRGYLKSARVIRPSGLDFLDRAAVEAFRGAAPFLNPPNGLVENGEIRFAQGFVVDMSGITDQLRHTRRR